MAEKKNDFEIDIRILEAKQQSFYKQMQHLYDLSRNLTDDLVLRNFLIRIKSLETLRKDYNYATEQLNVVTLRANPKAVINFDTLSSFDELYCHVKSAETDAVSKLSQNTNDNLDLMKKLPALELRGFDGTPNMWTAFYENFSTLIHNNSKLSNAEKIQYLIGKLSGKALLVCSGIQPVAGNYEIIWNALKEKYEDKRTLASMYFEQILSFKINQTSTQISLDSFIEQFCSAQAALKRLEINDLADFIFTHLALTKLDKETVTLFEQAHRSEKMPSFDSLVQFVKEQSKIYTLRSTNSYNAKQTFKANSPQTKRITNVPARSFYVKNINESDASKASSTLVSSPSATRSYPKCPYCKDNSIHPLFRCDKFMERDPKLRLQFIRDNSLCINCLGFHQLESCKSRNRCFCGGFHHSKIHAGIEPATQGRAPAQYYANAITHNAPQKPVSQAPTVCITNDAELKSRIQCNSNNTTILLPSAIVYVFNSIGERHKMRVLLDSGSMCHIITKSFCDRLNLNINASPSVLQGIGRAEHQVQGHASITIHSRFDERCKYTIHARVIDTISDKIPNELINLNNLNHLENLPLADDEFHTPGDIDCLIGNELFPFLLGSRKVMSPDSPVVGVQTSLGYVLMGKATCLTPTPIKEKSFHAYSKSTDLNLEELTQRFWELDSVPNKKHLSHDDTSCERIFLDSISRNKTGRYTVSLPFRDDPAVLGHSYEIAKRRLLNLEKKINAIPELRKDYNETILEYITKGYLNFIKNPEPGPCYYIPHHAVYRPDKTSSRTRVVLDASCKTISNDKSNRSLNDILYTGPNLQANIFDLLINLRLFLIALSADIEKMYFQIKLSPDNHRYQRILFRFDPAEPIETYEFNCVTFGVSSSPYLAMRVVKHLAKDERTRFPAAAWAAERHFYMDDYVSSVPSIEEAKNLYHELVQLFNAGGFKLTKWISNSTHLLQEIPSDLRSPNIVQFDENSITANTKIVGLQWEPNNDVFTFKVNVPNESKCTKRIILSITARLFDPLSLLGPVTALLKLLVQECWKLNLDWDDDVPPSIEKQWFQLQRELPLLEQLKIPRHIGILSSTKNISLIGFADASEKCYGAVIYLRVSPTDTDEGQVTLLCSRSRVASPKCNVSLPRLELCANLLLSNLIVAVKDSISERVKINKIIAFSDSTVALSWICAPPHRFQTFVANRIAAINSNLPAENWYHVSGKENPADIISRPIMPTQLLNNMLWFHGPPWVSQSFHEWPVNAYTTHAIDELPEHKNAAALTATVSNNNNYNYNDLYDSANRMSNWNKFLHSWVYVLRFSKVLKSHGQITVTDLEITEIYILSIIQKRHSFDTRSPALRKLNAFTDSNDIIRVGGRLSQSQLGYSQKHPIVLPAKDRIVQLIVDYFHRQNAHAGPALLLALLRQNYWVIAARNMVRKRVQSCNRCFKLKPKNPFPIMGDLPHYRVSEVKSFVSTGVDYAGPFYITPYRRRGVKSMKAYLCLFICLTTKALHLELASDLSSEVFLNAFRRFISRRGPVSLIISDNGGAFVAANKKLSAIHELLSKDSYIDQYLADLRIQFKHNPPYGSHFGGIYESNIKCVKTHLSKVIGTQILTYEEFNTVLIQIEGIMNSRPLCVLSSDPSEPTALTPSHFLNITPLKYLPAEDFIDVPQNRLNRYELLSKLVQSYWQRWSREYLSSLQGRQKWNTPSPPIEIGRIVIIREDNSPPLSWPLGIVEEVYPGKDKVVRTAKVKTRTGSYVRPVVRLCPLPLQ